MTNDELPHNLSGFSSVDHASDPTEYIRRLDERSAKPFWREVKTRVNTILDVSEGMRILDIGCGTGDDTRAIAQLTGPKGVVVGLDSSATMLNEARRRAKASRLPIVFLLGDAHELGFPDETFDGCHAERVLQHVQNPRQAIFEMVRVTKMGGRIVCVEPDYGSTIITGSEQQTTQLLVSNFTKQYRNSRIGILLPHFFMKLGLKNISVEIRQRIRSEYTSDDRSFLQRKYVYPGLQAKLISLKEGENWLEDIRSASERGDYAHILNILIVKGFK